MTDRAHLYKPVVDTAGNVVPNINVALLQPGTETSITEQVYTGPTGSNTFGSTFDVPDGIIKIYLAAPKRVRIKVTPVGGAPVYFEDIDVAAPDATDALTLQGHPASYFYSPDNPQPDNDPAGSSGLSTNADRYSRRTYATSYKNSSPSVTVANGGKVPLPLNDDYDNVAGSITPAGIQHYSSGGIQYGLTFPVRGLYQVNWFLGIDTTGDPFTVVCADRQSYNGYDYTRYLDPAQSDRPHRILEFTSIVASDGDTNVATIQTVYFQILSATANNKILSAWISAMPL